MPSNRQKIGVPKIAVSPPLKDGIAPAIKKHTINKINLTNTELFSQKTSLMKHAYTVICLSKISKAREGNLGDQEAVSSLKIHVVMV